MLDTKTGMKKNLSHWLGRLLFAMITLQALPAQATQWFEVDMIVFANESGQWSNQEFWRKPPEVYPELSDETVPFGDMEYHPDQLFQMLRGSTEDRNQMMVALDKGGKYRVLFTSSWRQQITAKGRATPMLIKVGERFGERHELEGTFKLYLGRYLHLETDLWLNHFMLREEAIRKGLLDATSNEESALSDQMVSEGEFPEDQYQAYGETPDARSSGSRSTAGDRQGAAGYYQQSNYQQPNYPALANSRLATDSPYIAVQAAPLQQSRRMRSDEVHYIDHPLMGILIKIKKYEMPNDASDPMFKGPDFNQPSNANGSNPTSQSSQGSNPNAQQAGSSQNSSQNNVLEAPWEQR